MWLQSSSERWMTINVADCSMKTIQYIGTTSWEDAFAELGPCPFDDYSSGLRRSELTSLPFLTTLLTKYSEINGLDQHHKNKTISILNIYFLNVLTYLTDLFLHAKTARLQCRAKWMKTV